MALKNLASMASLDPLLGRRIAVLGFGAQGAAHALNLRDSGLDVRVGVRPGSSFEAAQAAGLTVGSVADAAAWCDVLLSGLPDEAYPEIYASEIAPHLRSGATLGFLHGFVITYRQIEPRRDCDVILLAPKGQGRAVRNEFLAGRGVGALIAVHQNPSGRAKETALAWCAGIGAHRTAIFETTFAAETETDLFGEQAVLCGGVSALIRAAYETLVEAGYPPELAYLECCHELKLVVDLVYESGIDGMRRKISQTACFGDVTRGPRVVDAHVRERMREILAEIRSGEFAREWIEEAKAGKPNLRARVEADAKHAMELTGARVRGALWGKRE
jgi:ketol-acid reductoisomerase